MKVIGVIVMWAMLAVLVLCAALWPFARHTDRQGRPGLLHSALSNLRRLTLSTLLALSTVFTISVAHSGKNTNGVQSVGGQFLMQFTLPQAVTPQDFSNGWRVVEETGAEPFAQPSANAVTNERWRLRGAHDDAFRIAADGWSYSSATGVTVLSRGELRTSIHAHDFPRAFEQDLSLVPVVNWTLLPEGRRESFFWHDVTTSNTLLTTWWNAALGRDVANPVNFQAELFPNGMFTYRYEDRTVRHVRVWPFDWDDDGLENSVDPDPLTVGPDAHDTNAEWYNMVCSNALEAVAATSAALPPELTWREGVNSNAYYFVDVVAAQGPAPIYFTGDRDSRLGNPVVMALAGVTNRVPLLIGIDYAVTSIVPFMVSFPDDGFAVVTTNGVANYEIRWPLEFSVSPDGTGGFYIDVIPYDPGGTFQWGGGGAGGLRSGGSEASSCEYSIYGNWLGFTCLGPDCGCHGCAVDGTYGFECSTFNLPTLFCGCYSEEGDPMTPPPLTPSVDITFSAPALIFEDHYEASPDNWVEKRSTTNVLTVSAYGGENGGTLILTTQNLGCLRRIGGGAVSLPAEIDLGPYMSYRATFRCEGAENGGTPGVWGIISGPDGTDSSYAQTSVVRVEIQRQRVAPNNNCLHRHEYGIGEQMLFIQRPSSPELTISAPDTTIRGVATRTIEWGILDIEHSLLFSLPGVEYVPLVTIRRPTGIEGFDVQTHTNGFAVGSAGGIQLVQRYKVLPLTVDFSALEIEEVPCDDEIPPTGYFSYTSPDDFYRSHTSDAGAGEWLPVGSGNYAGEIYNARDLAGSGTVLPRRMPDGTETTNTAYGWLGGSLIWKVPFGWRKQFDRSTTEPVGRFAEGERQIMSITADGDFSVQKLGHEAIRRIDGTITLDGNADDGIIDN